MTKEENNNKFQKLYDVVVKIIDWAEEQGHISEEGAIILLQNITEQKEIIEKE